MYYLKKNDEEFAVQLTSFSDNLGTYQELFEISNEDLEQAEKDSAYFAWAIKIVQKQEETKKGWTGFKNNLRNNPSNTSTNPVPEPVITAPIPDAVAPGIQARFTTLVNRIKSNNNYTRAIGQILGIENGSQNRPPVEEAQPTLRAFMNGGFVNLYWKKGDFNGIVIEKDTGDGFVAFDKDLYPNYVDPTVIPTGYQSAVWRYRAMYLDKDVRVGLWSDVVVITVGD